ncbi:MAG: hypothetical protein QJR09_11855, partial [Micrococcus sp.]|nr:hypothetical protein [Micrococcus sp.]
MTLGTFDVLRPGIAGVLASTVSGLPGWWSTPDTKHDDQERSVGDGDFPSLRRYAARVLSIEGDVTARDPHSLGDFRNRLAGLLGSGPETLTVHGFFGPTQQATVYRDGGLQWELKSPVAARWQLPLKAPDPRKYGLSEYREAARSG